MSDDEQPWYVGAEAPAEADRVLHRMVETPVEADRFRIGTAVPESIALDPVQSRERMGGLLQPAQQGVPAFEQASPQLLEPQERILPAERVLPRQGLEHPAEALLPRQGVEQPVEPFQQARTDYAAPTPEHRAEPAQALLRPMERDEPFAQATPAHVINRPSPAHVMNRPAAARNAASGSGSSGGNGSGSGSGFRVDPDQYRAAVTPMLAAADQLADVYRSLNAYLPSLEAQDPWGNDESGKKFAEGDLGYVKISHSTMTLLKSLPDGLKNIAEGLKRMADSYQNADENTVAELGGIESTAQMPTSPSLPSTPLHLPITPGMTQSGRH
ncbi:hypothetical protein [Kitasatospora sp. NPDC057198]|uniref:WXG100 family type VII secretion target n=1 Tax=Kitasatospora sp. NPDC057198 TaxID=3346046 RepID=UPI00363FCD3D